MAVKPLISSFKQRGKIETLYLGEAAKEMAPPLLLGAALLILTLTGVSVLFRHFSEEKPPKSHKDLQIRRVTRPRAGLLPSWNFFQSETSAG